MGQLLIIEKLEDQGVNSEDELSIIQKFLLIKTISLLADTEQGRPDSENAIKSYFRLILKNTPEAENFTDIRGNFEKAIEKISDQYLREINYAKSSFSRIKRSDLLGVDTKETIEHIRKYLTTLCLHFQSEPERNTLFKCLSFCVLSKYEYSTVDFQLISMAKRMLNLDFQVAQQILVEVRKLVHIEIDPDKSFQYVDKLFLLSTCLLTSLSDEDDSIVTQSERSGIINLIKVLELDFVNGLYWNSYFERSKLMRSIDRTVMFNRDEVIAFYKLALYIAKSDGKICQKEVRFLSELKLFFQLDKIPQIEAKDEGIEEILKVIRAENRVFTLLEFIKLSQVDGHLSNDEGQFILDAIKKDYEKGFSENSSQTQSDLLLLVEFLITRDFNKKGKVELLAEVYKKLNPNGKSQKNVVMAIGIVLAMTKFFSSVVIKKEKFQSVLDFLGISEEETNAIGYFKGGQFVLREEAKYQMVVGAMFVQPFIFNPNNLYRDFGPIRKVLSQIIHDPKTKYVPEKRQVLYASVINSLKMSFLKNNGNEGNGLNGDSIFLPKVRLSKAQEQYYSNLFSSFEVDNKRIQFFTNLLAMDLGVKIDVPQYLNFCKLREEYMAMSKSRGESSNRAYPKMLKMGRTG